MPKTALYVSAAVFTLMVVLFSLVFVFDFDVVVGRTFYRPVNSLAVGIFLAVMAVWMFIASRDVQE